MQLTHQQSLRKNFGTSDQLVDDDSNDVPNTDAMEHFDDGVDLGIEGSQDDEYADESAANITQSEADDSSSDDDTNESNDFENLQDKSPEKRRHRLSRDSEQTEVIFDHEAARRRQSESETDEEERMKALRGDPLVHKLFKQLMSEEQGSRKETSQREKGTHLRSPSDTTIYAPALTKLINSPQNSPVSRHLTNNVDQISDFIEKVRLETRRGPPTVAHGDDRAQGEHLERGEHSKGSSPAMPKSRSKELADKLTLDAERF